MFAWSPLPRTLEAALRDVSHPKPRVRVSAVADLARWAGVEASRRTAVASLSASLRHDDDLEVRAAAALALADCEATEALGDLVRAARRGPPRVTQMALVAVGELASADDAAARALVQDLAISEAPALRFQALIAASRLLAPEALSEHLEAALGADEPRLRHLACRIAEERFFPGEPARSTHEVECAELSPASRDRLLQLLAARLKDSSQSVAVAAAIVLCRRGEALACRVLVSALNSTSRFEHPDDEQAALELCAEHAGSQARPGLRSRAWGGLFSGPSPLAFQARVALARMGDERAVRFVLRGLSSWSRRVRTQSAAAAGQARLSAARGILASMRGNEAAADSATVEEALRHIDEARAESGGTEPKPACG